ncbi:MAG: DUF4340 domain-containing protein [candidate division Zixibacteria bacterium]
MNKKMIYTLLVVLVALIVISYALKGLDRATSSPESLDELRIEFDPGEVTRIDVYKQDYPDSGLHFAKHESGWVVVNAYNSPAKVEDIEKLITDLTDVRGSVRGESADLYGNFDITDEKALQIELFGSDDAKLVHLYVGKGSGGRECFMRMAGTPVVYLADENFISRFAAWNAPPEKKLPMDRWLQLTLCDIDRDSMTSFEINKGKTAYDFAFVEEPSEDTLTPPIKAWKQISPKKGLKLGESKIKSLSSSLAGLRAADVIDPSEKSKFGLDKPKYVIRAGDDQENTAEIYFGNKIDDSEDRYAAVKGRESVYKVSKSTFERFFVKPFETD